MYIYSKEERVHVIVILRVAINGGGDLVGQVDPTLAREGCKGCKIESRQAQNSAFEAPTHPLTIWGGFGFLVYAPNPIAAWCRDTSIRTP